MRHSTLAALTMVISCVREAAPSSPPPPLTTVSAAALPSAVVEAATASSSPATLTRDSVSAAPPFDTLGNLRGLSPRDSLCGDLVENGLAIRDTRRTVVTSQFGRPDSTQSEPTPNKHNPAQTDSTVNVFYPGLRLHYVVLGVKEGETDILYRADVSSNRYLKYPSLGIGATRQAIGNAVGEPETRTDDTARYSCALHIMAGVTLEFHFEGDRVKFAEYWFDVD